MHAHHVLLVAKALIICIELYAWNVEHLPVPDSSSLASKFSPNYEHV